jgi:hypothetical protein
LIDSRYYALDFKSFGVGLDNFLFKVFQALLANGQLAAVKKVELEETDLKRAEDEYIKIKKEIDILKDLDHLNIAK